MSRMVHKQTVGRAVLHHYNGTIFLQNFGNTLLLFFISQNRLWQQKSKRNYFYFMTQVHWVWRLGLEVEALLIIVTQRSRQMDALSQHMFPCSPQEGEKKHTSWEGSTWKCHIALLLWGILEKCSSARGRKALIRSVCKYLSVNTPTVTDFKLST